MNITLEIEAPAFSTTIERIIQRDNNIYVLSNLKQNDCFLAQDSIKLHQTIHGRIFLQKYRNN